MAKRHTLWQRLATLFVVGCILLCLSGCREAGINANFVLPLGAEPRQLDPQVSSDAASVELEMALFEGLTRLNETGEPEPAAATWSVSEDRCTYTFSLRTAVWSDGSPVTAMDFVYGIRRAADPATASPLKELLRGIEGADTVLAGRKPVTHLGVIAQNTGTLIIRLTKPDTSFLQKLASPPFFPCREAFFTACNGKYGLEKDYVLGNGPFVLSRWRHGTSISLARSETYREKETILPATVRYEISTGESRLSALTNGTIDAALLRSEQEITAATAAGMNVVSLHDTLYGLWFNCTLPVLNQAAVRTALRDAVEWDLLKKDLPSSMQAATGYVVPDSVVNNTAYRTEQNAFSFQTDVAAASRLQQALGDTACPQFTLLCTEEELVVARDIVQSWQKNLSVYFALETVSEEVKNARLKAGNYELALGNVIPSNNSAVNALACFASDALAGNYARFANQAYDTYVNKAKASGAQRDAEAAEAALAKQCPMIPIAFVSTHYGVNPHTENLQIRPFGGGNHGAVFGFMASKKTED